MLLNRFRTSFEEKAEDSITISKDVEPLSTSSTARPVQILKGLLQDLVFAVIFCVLVITYGVQIFKVQGASMSPWLQDGDRILVNKFIYRISDIERGDVVVFWYPENPEMSFIKRIVGLQAINLEDVININNFIILKIIFYYNLTTYVNILG